MLLTPDLSPRCQVGTADGALLRHRNRPQPPSDSVSQDCPLRPRGDLFSFKFFLCVLESHCDSGTAAEIKAVPTAGVQDFLLQNHVWMEDKNSSDKYVNYTTMLTH